MQVRNHGKYTKMSSRDPRGIARCDYSGLMVRHADLVKQKQYRGRGLVWTGLMVSPKFADIQNPQELITLSDTKKFTEYGKSGQKFIEEWW